MLDEIVDLLEFKHQRQRAEFGRAVKNCVIAKAPRRHNPGTMLVGQVLFGWLGSMLVRALTGTIDHPQPITGT